MIISSTEFQQNVGKYLAMAEKGIPIIIERKKPKAACFRISLEKSATPTQTNRAKRKEFQTWLAEMQSLERINPNEDSVTYQRRMRSWANAY